MPTFNVTRTVPFSAEQVYSISCDVAQYRQFIPLVKRSVVRSKTTNADGTESFEAELTVAYKKLNIEETMASAVTADPVKHVVVSTAKDGPVKHLVSTWTIRAQGPNQCEVNLEVDYALKSKALQFVLSGMFDMIVRRIMTAFEERARTLYGAPGEARVAAT
jgi:coenzyme Q-binding protein COQ10